MTLEEFERELTSLIGRRTEVRPFVCEGSPLQCEVFLVGLNPATMMDADFWDFWRPGYGFDKAAWFECYLAERAARPLKPGRSRRQKVSATRRNIECFAEGADGVRVLETNIYAHPSDDLRGLAPAGRTIAPFQFLLRSVSPRVIVVHGQPALETVRDLDIPVMVIEADRHFSRGISKEAARRYGAAAAKACMASR